MTKVTREMIAAAHDVTMRHKIVLGHELLGEIYQAMKSASPAQRKPLTDEEIWKDDVIMAANSGYGANFETLRELIRAIEAAHGIKENT